MLFLWKLLLTVWVLSCVCCGVIRILWEEDKVDDSIYLTMKRYWEFICVATMVVALGSFVIVLLWLIWGMK
jgi:hypothetical protein